MDQWIDNASLGHFFNLMLAGVAAGFFGILIYDLIAARLETSAGIKPTGLL